MNERHQDFELLQRFVRHGEQSAFADVVRRHLDLVFGTALRKVEDAGAAQEVAQNVFAALSRKAWQFAPDDSLPAWLHKTALYESNTWLRGELRRRRREQTATELGTTMKASEAEPAFEALVPLLDEALLSLREKDRTALLLRFYESQSLRDVGAAVGVSEDAARMRVQTALEKLTAFFKRRGFKTATVAAAAAALQHTAATTTAAVASTVITTVLQTAPQALVGLSLLLARLASMSRMQTAAVCIALATVPLVWQLNERHTAGEEAKRIQTQLLAAQNQNAAAQTELERLQAQSSRLEQSVAQANAAAARAAESARAFEAWKQRTRGQLLATDYRWDDDSPFVRIPKAMLPALNELTRTNQISPPGVVNPYARELLGLSRAESQKMEDILQRVAELQRGEPAEVYEGDAPFGGGTVAARTFFRTPPGKVGAEAEQRFAQMVTEFSSLLGEERWSTMPARFRGSNSDVWNRALIPEPKARITASVEVDGKGTSIAKWHFNGESTDPKPEDAKPEFVKADKSGTIYSLNAIAYVNKDAPLSTFLPNGNPDPTKGALELHGIVAHEAMRRRAFAWFQEQAVARLAEKVKP